MFTNHPKAAALGAFLAGGVLVGAVSLGMGVAHGAGSGAAGKGLSDAQYTAKNAWAQTIPSGGVGTTLLVPAGDRLTITDALGAVASCGVTGVLSGTTVSYTLATAPDGTVTLGTSSSDVGTEFVPVSLDSGSAACGNFTALVGYLTPVPAG